MVNKLNACGLILAGGQSSRMGTNKALLRMGETSLIERLASRLQDWFAQVVIVTNTPEIYQFLGLPMTGDQVPGLGPLGGIEAGLQFSQFDHNFFVACDMPFVDESLVRYLISRAPAFDMVVPEPESGLEPMHAVYNRSCLPTVSAHRQSRQLRLVDLLGALRVHKVSGTELTRFGDPDKLFFNCNTPLDLQRALEWERMP